MTDETLTQADERSPAQFFFEMGFGACFAEAMIRNGNKAPFTLTDAEIERQWAISRDAYDDPAELDAMLARTAHSGEGRSNGAGEDVVEAVAQWLHDEGGFGDSWTAHTWPEHSDDTGQREGGWVKIVPSDVQAQFRDVARRLLTQTSAEAALSAHQGEVERVSAIDDIAAERRRQVEAEGWTPDHDDEHGDGSLAAAAATYAFSAATADRFLAHDPIGFWPWAAEWWKPSTPRRDLVKAGALIVAEIERIDRAALAQPEGEAK